MNYEMITLAAKAAQNQGKSSGFALILIYGVLILAFYFFLIRPQRKKNKEEKKMRENLQVGDEIVTIGGLYGRVISLKEDTMVIESISDHSKLTFSRSALQFNNTVHDEVPEK